jgi:hypothetical protein
LRCQCIHAVIRKQAAKAVRIGLETGQLSTWLFHEPRAPQLPVICIDARHAKAALSLQINKTDADDAHGIAQIAFGRRAALAPLDDSPGIVNDAYRGLLERYIEPDILLLGGCAPVRGDGSTDATRAGFRDYRIFSTCPLAEHRAQRQSRVPRHRRSQRAASLTKRARY